MGAWIEMTDFRILISINRRRILYGCVDWNVDGHSVTSGICTSHPIWVRGLKCEQEIRLFLAISVASYMGAWIEIYIMSRFYVFYYVASYMGAWIEIKKTWITSKANNSRILYGCVDWNTTNARKIFIRWSRILYGCVDWNETQIDGLGDDLASHPIWVRGLKWGYTRQNPRERASHPIWVRGLK